jgi:hypothetical protein
MATYTPPTQYQNVTDQPSVDTFNPNQANNFLTNFNDLAVDYSSNADTDEEQANNLIQAYQYLSNPANQAAEDAENGQGWSQTMLAQLQGDITEQTNLANYYSGNALPQDVGNLETQVGNIGAVASLGQINQQQLLQGLLDIRTGNNNTSSAQYANTIVNAIENSNSPMALNAAGGTMGGSQVNESNVQDLTNKIKTDPNTGDVLNWITAYVNTAQQGYQQLQQLQQTQNTQQNNILQGFTLGQAPVSAQVGQLANFYGVDQNGNPISGDNGQVQIAQGQAGQDIYQQAAQQRQQINQSANNVGANSSGERTLALGNVTANAANNAAQIYQQDANAAEQAINNYNQQLQQQNNATKAEETSVIGGGLSNLMNGSTQANLSAYEQNQNATNQQNLTNNENAINTAKQNSSLWNNIGSDIGQGVGDIAGVAVSRI